MYRSQLVQRGSVAAALLLGASLTVAAQTQASRRQDLLQLMGAALSVPSIAAYCEKFVVSNPELLRAAQRWNERHQKIQEFIVSEMKVAGDLSAEQKRYLDTRAYRALIDEMRDVPDKAGYCRDAAKFIDAGKADFRNRSDIAEVLKRLNIVP